MTNIKKILEKWASKEGIQFQSQEAEQKYAERAERLADAVQLKIPDKIPWAPDAGLFPLTYSGISLKEAMYNYDKICIALKKTITDFRWDAVPRVPVWPAKAFEILKYKPLRLPGLGLDDDAPTYQFVEPGQKIEGKELYEPMKPEEYDWFLEDPSDFNLRGHLSQVCDTLKPFANLPPINGITCYYHGYLDALATPDIDKAFEALAEAAREVRKWRMVMRQCLQDVKGMGFPEFFSALTHAPFDYIGDFRRGTRGILTDIFRNPEKVKAVCERVAPFMSEWGIRFAKLTGNPIVVFRLHKGIFMRPDQFEEFYWSTLKKVFLTLIKNDVIPYAYTEGDYRPYLEIIKEMPKGKIIYHIEQGIFEAKEILGDKFCLTGGIPASLLYTASPQKVEEYCKKAIEVLGENGGFILDSDVPLDVVKPENLKAVNEAVLKYGHYS